MRLWHLEGQAPITSAETLRAALALRCEGTNEFHLQHEHEFPSLMILAKGDLALVNYFPAEDEPGAIAAGDVPGLDPSGTTDLGGPRSRECWLVDNGQVVRAETAYALAEQFRCSAARPGGVEWIDLAGPPKSPGPPAASAPAGPRGGVDGGRETSLDRPPHRVRLGAVLAGVGAGVWLLGGLHLVGMATAVPAGTLLAAVGTSFLRPPPARGWLQPRTNLAVIVPSLLLFSLVLLGAAPGGPAQRLALLAAVEGRPGVLVAGGPAGPRDGGGGGPRADGGGLGSPGAGVGEGPPVGAADRAGGVVRGVRGPAHRRRAGRGRDRLRRAAAGRPGSDVGTLPRKRVGGTTAASRSS